MATMHRFKTKTFCSFERMNPPSITHLIRIWFCISIIDILFLFLTQLNVLGGSLVCEIKLFYQLRPIMKDGMFSFTWKF